MKKQPIILVLIAFVGLTLTSCYSHNWEKINPAAPITKPCILPDTASYANDIKPILTANCSLNNSACHSSGAGIYNMTTWSGVASFCTGDSTSKMYNSITWTDPTEKMPQNAGKLSPCDINKIIRWMNQGTKNN